MPHVPPAPAVPAAFRYPRSKLNRPIYFYDKDKPYFGFTNFSGHVVIYDGKRYPSSEHLYQSLKFGHKPHIAEYIRTCSRKSRVAFDEAHRFQADVRYDWRLWNIRAMDVALWHKFGQHRDLRKELLSTGNAPLFEDSKTDSFWGTGADGRGRNELGKAMERLRARLRDGG